MPTTLSQGRVEGHAPWRSCQAIVGEQRVERGRRQALPPRRPRSAICGTGGRWAISASLASAAPMKPTGKAQHQAGPRRALGQQLEQAEQRGRRIADRDHRTRQPVAPGIDRGGRAGGRARPRRAPRVASSSRVQRIGLAGGRLASDAGRDHGGIDQDRGAGARAPPGRRATASGVQARSPTMSGMPQAWIRRSATGCRSSGSRSIGASRRIAANDSR